MNKKCRLIGALFGAAAVVLLAGRAGATDSAEVIIEWNQILQTTIPTAGALAPRYYAMLHIAMFDAVNSIDKAYTPYHARVRAHRGVSAEAAAAQAAHDVLVFLIPQAEPTFNKALRAQLKKIPSWRAAAGALVGRKVAKQIIAWRQNDGEVNPTPPAYVLPPLPGLWQPTPPAFAVASFPHFRDVEPFALLTATQYLPDPPPTLTSDEYAADFEEVRRIGALNSAERTAEQTQTARLFASIGNSTVHFAMWNSIASDFARSQYWSLVDTARLFALLNASIHDGVQTSHASKFVYGLWRPVTAIQRADEDLNPQTAGDTAWSPLLTTPPYPSHASNQACVGTSAARALARAFDSDAMPFSVTWIGTAGNPDVTRSYGSFSQLADEQARSRVYAGIHFTFELTASDESCVQVADYVADNYMLPRRAYGDRH
jgi:hypothetical protein